MASTTLSENSCVVTPDESNNVTAEVKVKDSFTSCNASFTLVQNDVIGLLGIFQPFWAVVSGRSVASLGLNE